MIVEASWVLSNCWFWLFGEQGQDWWIQSGCCWFGGFSSWLHSNHNQSVLYTFPQKKTSERNISKGGKDNYGGCNNASLLESRFSPTGCRSMKVIKLIKLAFMALNMRIEFSQYFRIKFSQIPLSQPCLTIVLCQY